MPHNLPKSFHPHPTSSPLTTLLFLLRQLKPADRAGILVAEPGLQAAGVEDVAAGHEHSIGF